MPPSTAPVYRPVFSSSALDAAIARQRAALPPGKKLRTAVSVTNDGLRADALYALQPQTYVGGYAERLWGHPGWTWGVQGVLVR